MALNGRRLLKQDIEFSDDEDCGCGSGYAYAICCKKTRVQYTRDGRGSVYKVIVADEDGRKAAEEALQAFKRTFGRSPAGRDRMLLAAYRHSPQDFKRLFLEIAEKADLPKHLVYAYIKTDGLILTAENEELASPQDIEDAQNAVSEYFLAQDDGIDLLEPDQAGLSGLLNDFKDHIEDIVIFFGSFADRAPRAVRRSLPLFFQFLLISKCHQAIKTISDRWAKPIGDESLSALRTIYECTLVINRLSVDPVYSESLLAQALVGSDLYTFRSKNNGKIDFSTIIEVSAKRRFEARTSFLSCAKYVGERHVDLFEVAYPVLSSYIHFDTLNMLQSYRESGSFLLWNEPSPETQALLIFIITSYFLISVSMIPQSTKSIERDALYLFNRNYISLMRLIHAIDIENFFIDEGTKLLTIRAMELFTNQSFLKE